MVFIYRLDCFDLLTFALGVLARLQQTDYTINENENSQEVCIELLGRSQISVSVTLVTTDGSAISKFSHPLNEETCDDTYHIL